MILKSRILVASKFSKSIEGVFRKREVLHFWRGKVEKNLVYCIL